MLELFHNYIGVFPLACSCGLLHILEHDVWALVFPTRSVSHSTHARTHARTTLPFSYAIHPHFSPILYTPVYTPFQPARTPYSNNVMYTCLNHDGPTPENPITNLPLVVSDDFEEGKLDKEVSSTFM